MGWAKILEPEHFGAQKFLSSAEDIVPKGLSFEGEEGSTGIKDITRWRTDAILTMIMNSFWDNFFKIMVEIISDVDSSKQFVVLMTILSSQVIQWYDIE